MDQNSNPFNLVPKKVVAAKVQPNQQKEVVKTNDNQRPPHDHAHEQQPEEKMSQCESSVLKLQGNEQVMLAPSIADPSLVPGLVPAGVMKFQTDAPCGSFAKESDSALLSLERAKSKKSSPKLVAGSQIGGSADANKSKIKSTISQTKPKSAQSKKSQKSQKSSKSTAEVVKSKSSSDAKSAEKSSRKSPRSLESHHQRASRTKVPSLLVTTRSSTLS